MTATAASHCSRRTLYADPSRCRGDPVWSTTRRTSSGIGDRPPLERATVEEDGRSRHAAGRGELVHEPALHADVAVLGSLADTSETHRVHSRRHRPASPRPRPVRWRPTMRDRRSRGGSVPMTPRRPWSGSAGLGERPGRARHVIQPRAGARAVDPDLEPVVRTVVEPRQRDPILVRADIRDAGSRGRSRPGARNPGCSRCAPRSG